VYIEDITSDSLESYLVYLLEYRGLSAKSRSRILYAIRSFWNYTLESDTTAGTLYTLTVGDKSTNFGGKAKDTCKPEVDKIESTYFNEVKITFTEPIKTFGTVSLAKIMGDKAALEVVSVAYDGNNVIKLITAEQAKSTLYVVKEPCKRR
jgi:hypothetical protein